jgi:hypothetical protein
MLQQEPSRSGARAREFIKILLLRIEFHRSLYESRSHVDFAIIFQIEIHPALIGLFIADSHPESYVLLMVRAAFEIQKPKTC